MFLASILFLFFWWAANFQNLEEFEHKKVIIYKKLLQIKMTIPRFQLYLICFLKK